MNNFQVPVLFLVFNRPEQTRLVFEVIKRQRPCYLYISADGPRPDRIDDESLCKQVREIVDCIDWPCNVKRSYNNSNLGSKYAVHKAIEWFFSYVEEGIILEDDCLPNDSFFYYCEDLLIKYKNDLRVMMICGTSYQLKPLNNDSYYFSLYPHVWGWATWKTAWSHYQVELNTEPPETRNFVLRNTFSSLREVKFWEGNLNFILNNLDAWDYQWMYWMWKNGGVCITPWHNMISNIGFGLNATHTHDLSSDQAAMQQYELANLVHPVKIKVNKRADKFERYHILLYPLSKHLLIMSKLLIKRLFKAVWRKK